MKVLLLGSGAREHAIGWKLAQSAKLTELVSAPGNPGLAALGPLEPTLDPTDPDAVASYAGETGVDLIVVGPEAPLAAGVVDAAEDRGVPAFGPGSRGARLESSKSYAKDVMARAGVPTAAARSFTEDETAERYLRHIAGPYVVKADGLAAGKGVLVTEDVEAAVAWARACIGGSFGEAGKTVVVEEHLAGREVSVFAVTDGKTAVPLEPARDYKRLSNGDHGPNTGGMGCFSPVGDLPVTLVAETMETVIGPTLATLEADGVPYKGFLYAGLMLTADGIKVLEFNCRLGDPETQVVLPRLESDFLHLLATAADGHMTLDALKWSPRAAVDVVIAAPGYPERPETGQVISGIEEIENHDDVLVFHAGTGQDGDRVVARGGRVLNVVGLGDTVSAAREIAYGAARSVTFDGMQFRSDIAR